MQEVLLEEGYLVRDGSLADVPLAGTAESEPVSVARTSEAKVTIISIAVFAGQTPPRVVIASCKPECACAAWT
jgi:hypothetical protein